MIVVDTNVIAYLFIGGDLTPQARRTFSKDPKWVAPVLWRSEFRNVLASYLRRRALDLRDAVQLMREAEELLDGAEYAVASQPVLELSQASGCSAYDCEFVALARDLDAPLVTTDREVLAAFKPTAVALERFARR